MTDYLLDDLSKWRDNWGVWAYHMERDVIGANQEEALEFGARYGRDKCRTPMQWSNSPNAGFSPAFVETWLPVNPNHAEGVNFADQDGDPQSLLNFYRRMVRLRKQTPALIAGEYIPLHEEQTEYLAFLRVAQEQTCVVVLNYAGCNLSVRLDAVDNLVEGYDPEQARLLFSSHEEAGRTADLKQIDVHPYEILVLALIPVRESVQREEDQR